MGDSQVGMQARPDEQNPPEVDRNVGRRAAAASSSTSSAKIGVMFGNPGDDHRGEMP